MEKSSQRELLPVAQQCPIPQIMADLARALAGTGPALAFGEIEQSHAPAHVALVTSTSGSMGGPKAVGLSAGALLASARASNKFLGGFPGQTWSLLLPLNHIAGINVLVRSLELGTSPLDLRGSKDYKRADFTAIVPTQLFRALNGDAQLLEHLKNCQAVLVGGATLPDSMKRAAKEAGINVIQTYGMSETGGGCVYNGTPLDGVEIRTVNGVIQVKGPTLATTYLNDEEKWRESFDDGWLITNDLGEFENDQLTVFGRVDDVIISGGVNVSLNAVEETLKTKFVNADFAAFALPDSEWGSALHIAIADGAGISNEEITLLLEQTLGAAAKPKGLHRLSSLPLIGVGKVDRKVLSQLVRDEEAE